MSASDKSSSRKQSIRSPRARFVPVRTRALRGLDAALSALSARLPDFRISTMGEKPTRRSAELFFCSIEHREGSGIYLGRWRTFAQVVDEAVALAEGRA